MCSTYKFYVTCVVKKITINNTITCFWKTAHGTIRIQIVRRRRNKKCLNLS